MLVYILMLSQMLLLASLELHKMVIKLAKDHLFWHQIKIHSFYFDFLG